MPNTPKQTTIPSETVSFLVLGNFRWNHYFYIFPGLHYFGPKKFWPKQIVCTKMRFFSLPDTNSVRQFLQKIRIFCFFFTFLDDNLKNNFIGFFGLFHFVCFSFFCFYFSNIKERQKKCNFPFQKPHFWHPQNFANKKSKHYFGTMWHYLCFQKCPKNTIKLGKTVKINLDHFFNFKLGPLFNFNSRTPKSWTTF